MDYIKGEKRHAPFSCGPYMLLWVRKSKQSRYRRAGRGHLCQAVKREHWWGGDGARSPTPQLQLEGAQGSWLLGRLAWPRAGSGSGLKQDLARHLGTAGQVRRPHASLQSLFTWKRLARTGRPWESLRGPKGAGVAGVARTKPR